MKNMTLFLLPSVFLLTQWGEKNKTEKTKQKNKLCLFIIRYMKFADDFLSKVIWCFLLCKLFLNNILSIFIYLFFIGEAEM